MEGRAMGREHNDSWDLATSVGATATMVAAGRARASSAEEPLIDDPFAEPLVRAVGVDFFTRWASGELSADDVDLPGAPWGMQPMTDLLTARTRFFDQFLADAAAAGIRQAVILASGLDARGYRMDWPAGMTVFEIDQPKVLEFKAETLAELGAAPTADVRQVPVDLRDDWPAALREAGLDTDRPTAWIAEGLLPFLPPEAQDGLLDEITALSAQGSRLATEVMVDDTDTDDEPARAAMESVTERWRHHGFDVEFGELGYEGERKDVVAYLDDRGWSSTRIPLSQLLSDAGLTPAGGADTLTFGNNYYATSVLGGS
jgi:methyltransferase (TIGR00027 family)